MSCFVSARVLVGHQHRREKRNLVPDASTTPTLKGEVWLSYFINISELIPTEKIKKFEARNGSRHKVQLFKREGRGCNRAIHNPKSLTFISSPLLLIKCIRFLSFQERRMSSVSLVWPLKERCISRS